MTMNKIIFSLAVCVSLTAVAADPLNSQTTVKQGVWTSDFPSAQAYAEANNIPMVVFWANPGCSQCEHLEDACNTKEFKAWQAEANLIMVFAYGKDTTQTKAAYNWIRNMASEQKVTLKEYPFIGVYWKSNTAGKEVKGVAVGRTGRFGQDKSLSLAEQFEGYLETMFAGWDGSGTVTPVTTYTVTFVVDSTKGTASGAALTQTITSGAAATAPTVTAASGWTFAGWDKAFSNVTSDLTVTAQFTAIEPDPEPTPAATYTVEFVVDSGKGTATGAALSQTVASGKAATAPTVTAASGWKFAGWDKAFSNVTSDLTVTAQFKAVTDREEVDVNTVFKKAQSLKALIYDAEETIVGQATIALSRLSSKGLVTVKVTLSTFAGKRASASFKATPNEYGDLEGSLPFKKAMGNAMDCVLTYADGAFSIKAKNDTYALEIGSMTVGGALTATEMTFSVDMESIEGPSEAYDSLVVGMPSNVVVTVTKGTKFNCGKAPTIKYVGNATEGYDISGLDDEAKPNENAVSLSYKTSTGAFTGTFKVWFSNKNLKSLYNDKSGKWKKPSLKSYTARVSGVIVSQDGQNTGFGVVTLKIGSTTYSGTCMLSE